MRSHDSLISLCGREEPLDTPLSAAARQQVVQPTRSIDLPNVY